MKTAKRMSIKEMWHFILFQTKSFPSMKYIILFGSVSAAVVTYIDSFLYAKILDSLLAQAYSTATRWVIVLVLSVLLVQLLAAACNRIYQHGTYPAELNAKKRTAQKAFSMEYEEIERTETLQSFRRVRQGENGHGGIKYQLQLMYSYFTELAKVFFACGFVALLLLRSDFQKESIFVFVLSTALLAAAFAGVLWLGKKNFEKIGEKSLKMNLENERSNTLASYIVNFMMSEEWGQDIRLYQTQSYFVKKFRAIFEIAKGYIEYGRYNGKYNGAMSFVLQLLAGITYGYIVLKAMAGSVSTGQVLMYAGAIITMMDSIRNAMKYRIDIDYSNEYLKTYEEFINRPNMHYDGTLPIEKRIDNQYELSFRHVSFRYPDTEQYVLKDINLTFRVGEKLALVGKNGAGKTTLIKLLLRLYEPTEGQILLNGIDIGKYDYDEYVQIFSVVFQDFQLYHFPLDENIAGSENVDEEKLARVLKQVGLTERVEHMREGRHTLLYHEVGDGEALSGGEAQKVAIARALYKDAPFVILDEPTAALDPVAEAEIYENFNGLMGEKTAVYISHRMSSCKFCDNILVLEQGKIAEFGIHQELLDRQGRYYELYQAQAQHYL